MGFYYIIYHIQNELNQYIRKNNMKLYVDICCYNRPQDDQSDERIEAETYAILKIIGMRHINDYIIVGSPIVDMEIQQNPKPKERDTATKLYRSAIDEYIIPSTTDFDRAKTFIKNGLGVMDSYHLAAAEAADADILITVDKDFERISTNKKLSRVIVINPLKFK
jgi:predicted nucleic acid-binding protein